MNTMTKCRNANCSGHLTRFSSCLAEALYFDGGFDQEFGVSSEDGWYAITIEAHGADLEHPDGFTIALRPGVYVLHEDSLGFVYLYKAHDLDHATDLVDDFIRVRDTFSRAEVSA